MQEIKANDGDGVDIKFSHVHLYVDQLCDVSAYKEFEESLTQFEKKYNEATTKAQVEQQAHFLDVKRGRQLWQSITNAPAQEEFVSHGRDVVRQLIAGFGFRVTGCHATSTTNSVVVTSKDVNGIHIVVSALKNTRSCNLSDADEAASTSDVDYHQHFAASNITRFYQAHSNRQGIAVLAFQVGKKCLQGIYQRYAELHPELIPKEFQNGPVEYDEMAIFEVFAYYRAEKGTSSADEGTMLRFVEPIDSRNNCKLSGIVNVDATFSHCHCAYFDHWVSNVISRTGFLDTLEDTLYFSPKVDFNAGVVAAGEAQIESTVTGNTSSLEDADDGTDALSNQSQIYLPINNALTKVGHVHGFLTFVFRILHL